MNGSEQLITEPLSWWRFADGKVWWGPTDTSRISGIHRPVVILTVLPGGIWTAEQR